MAKLLQHINSPEDVRGLDAGQLRQLCGEIREYIVECCAVNPGHLGSSLGAVELIVGLHYTYNTPTDKLVFDVGHQAYAHKILTGRRDAFRLNRQEGGVSGFPRRDESPFDAFGTGHSSTSISAALGLAEAARLTGSDQRTVAVIGDGALTGGLAWEGLNNAGGSRADLLVILNDNNISIDKNIGAMHEYLLRLTTGATYNKVKGRIWDRLGESRLRDWVQKQVANTKSNLVRGSGGAVFEALGFRYFGPIDGNDIDKVTGTLRRLRHIKGPRILHCLTTKGKGYAPAEAEPTVWHAPGRFDASSGERLYAPGQAARFQDVFGETLAELARKDERVVGITPAMSSGCGMNILERQMPERFFDVGIEEEHAVTFSAGLAAGGMRPFCNIYSSFSQRAYDQLIHDVALQNLPVVLCLDRAGLVGEDGATHHGCFDLSYSRAIPNAIVAAPRNELELKNMMYAASQTQGGPYIIRYPRGTGPGTAWRDVEAMPSPTGRGELLLDGCRVAVLALGLPASFALEAALEYREANGTGPKVYDMKFLKPIDERLLEEAALTCRAILTVEDGTIIGGLYGAVTEYMASHGHHMQIRGLGIPDRFIHQASQERQRAACGIDKAGIRAAIEDLMKK